MSTDSKEEMRVEAGVEVCRDIGRHGLRCCEHDWCHLWAGRRTVTGRAGLYFTDGAPQH